MLLGHSNYSAFFKRFSITDFFYILYFLSIICTNALPSSVGGRRALQTLGPGFDSQVPPKFHIIFHNVIAWRYSKVSHHGLPFIQTPSVSKDRSKGQKMRSTMLLVNPCSRQFQKSKGLDANGPQNFQIHLHSWVNTPIGFYFFFYFPFLFIIFSLVIIIIII